MAAKVIEKDSSNPMDYIGTDAERIALDTSILPVGCNFTVTLNGSIVGFWQYDGTVWNEL